MPTGDYQTVSLPKEFIDRIKKISDNPKYGFSSIADFVRDSIRINLKFYESLEKKMEKELKELEKPIES